MMGKEPLPFSRYSSLKCFRAAALTSIKDCLKFCVCGGMLITC